MGTHLRVLSESYPIRQGLDGFQESMHPCDLGESSVIIGRVKEINETYQPAVGFQYIAACHASVLCNALLQFISISFIGGPGRRESSMNSSHTFPST